MSKKYIKQQESLDFVFPNNELSEYDIEIIHDINNNCVQGAITNFSASTISTSSLSFSFNYVWTKNNAEPYIYTADGNETLSLVSVHMLTPDIDYYKPWRTVSNVVSTGSTTGSTYSGTHTFTITASDFQVSNFSTGNYYFEFRFIGKRCIYPVCAELTNSVPTPTPTPTPSITPTHTVTPTITPTPSITPTHTPTVTPSAPVGDFTLSPAYGISMTALSTTGGQSLPAFTFPTTGTTQQTLQMVQGYTGGTTFSVTLDGTRTPPQTLNVSLLKNSVVIDCLDINSDPSSQVFTLTASNAITINDDLRISIGLGGC